MAAPQKRVVTLRYEDLVAGKDLTEEIFEAYGPDGLGALTISGIPGFSQQREELLPLGHTLAHLPEEKLSKLEDAESLWNAGWSYGKEKFAAEPDTSKGSFYANPLYDVAVSEEVRKSNLYAYPKNIWPKEDLPAMEPAFKTLGKTMYEVVVLLTKQIDALVEKRIPGYKKGMLHELISTTKKIKGRLLYYYPVDKSKDKEDGWIGWHNDSGFLTALTSAMFFDDDAAKPMANPDPMGGLWIVSRGHDNVHVKIPSDHLAVQCGECLQIVTGGLLVATPHCVRPSFSDNVKVGRATFPVFIDSDIHFKLEAPAGRSRDDVFEHTARSKVPPLDQRWTHDGMTFSEFLKVSFEQYYTWNLKK